MRATLEKLITRVYIEYLEFVIKTSTLSFEMEPNFEKEVLSNCIIGFWHGHSYSMNIVLKKLRRHCREIHVIVTNSERGDYIEGMLNHYEAKALRTPDGIGIKDFLRHIKDIAREKDSTICVALDGPVGPFMEPKKLGFTLSKHSEKPFVGVKFNFSKEFAIKKRWDKYTIPLPFSRIHMTMENFGVISIEQLQNFNCYKHHIAKLLA